MAFFNKKSIFYTIFKLFFFYGMYDAAREGGENFYKKVLQEKVRANMTDLNELFIEVDEAISELPEKIKSYRQ